MGLCRLLCYEVVCDSVFIFPHNSVSFACMGLKRCKGSRGNTGVVRTLTHIQPPARRVGRDTTMDPMWMFDVDYLTQNNISSQLRIIVSNAAVSTIVPSYVIYVKRRYKLLPTVHRFRTCGCT